MESLTMGSGRILVVEADRATRNLVCKILERCGYTPVEAASGEDAIKMYFSDPKNPVEAVVATLRLPEKVDARDVAEVISIRQPGVRMLIMIEDLVDESVTVSSTECGRFVFISKPVSAVMLSQRLRELLDAP